MFHKLQLRSDIWPIFLWLDYLTFEDFF